MLPSSCVHAPAAILVGSDVLRFVGQRAQVSGACPHLRPSCRLAFVSMSCLMRVCVPCCYLSMWLDVGIWLQTGPLGQLLTVVLVAQVAVCAAVCAWARSSGPARQLLVNLASEHVGAVLFAMQSATHL